jgi:hypothetical protein
MEYYYMIFMFKKELDLMIYHLRQDHIKWDQYLKAHLIANHFEKELKRFLSFICFLEDCI